MQSAATVRSSVRELLERSPAYQSLPPATRRTIAKDMTTVSGFLAGGATDRVDFPSFVSGTHRGRLSSHRGRLHQANGGIRQTDRRCCEDSADVHGRRFPPTQKRTDAVDGDQQTRGDQRANPVNAGTCAFDKAPATITPSGLSLVSGTSNDIRSPHRVTPSGARRLDRSASRGAPGHRASHRQRGQTCVTAPTFVLQPGVRERGQDDMAMPAGKRAAFEMIESEFVLQFLILLFDRPALMRQPDQGAQRRGGRQRDEDRP